MTATNTDTAITASANNALTRAGRFTDASSKAHVPVGGHAESGKRGTAQVLETAGGARPRSAGTCAAAGGA
ncbi:hypothetical protein GCM10010243_52670 [Streptomyces matensis]|nr:hypothetical protein GCM10010243_52670 [Streptomyces matensis]